MLAELRSSASIWHSLQLAVLGFSGLCGMLQRGSSAAPSWLQVLAAILAFGALGLACLATFLTRGVAWPLYGWSGASANRR
jgi:hypothetical protein